MEGLRPRVKRPLVVLQGLNPKPYTGFIRFRVCVPKLNGANMWGPAIRLLPKPPKVCNMMAFRAIIMSLGLLFYIFWWFR